MTPARLPLLLLVALMCLPAVVLAEEEPSEDAAEQEKPCKFPTELLWHNESDDQYRMGVSVLNENQQQVPNLKPEYFKVFLDDQPVERAAETFKVAQSKSAFSTAAAGSDPGASAALGVDPVHYDLYFSLDLTASMAEKIQIEGQSKARDKIDFVANDIHEMFAKAKLFDSKDRVYISGFSSRLETNFMSETTADRQALKEGLRALLKFKPTGTDAALYHAMSFNLQTIRDRAAQYTGDKERRQAVLVMVTDSFNGMDMNARKSVKACRNNKNLTERVRESVRATSEATNGNFKLYILAVGNPGETGRYKLKGNLSGRCNIRSTQKEVVDSRSFSAITADRRELRFAVHPNPLKVLGFLEGQFESLRRAYEISYKPPEGISRARKFRVEVEIGEHKCVDEVEETSGFIRKTATRSRHSPEEMAMLLAALIFTFFFIPRSLSNVSTVLSGGSGGAAQAEPKKKRRRKRKKRK